MIYDNSTPHLSTFSSGVSTFLKLKKKFFFLELTPFRALRWIDRFFYLTTRLAISAFLVPGCVAGFKVYIIYTLMSC